MRRAGSALLLLAIAAGTARAQYDPRFPYDPPSLPQTLRGTVVVPVAEAAKAGPISTLAEISPALGACWRVPDGLARLERGEVTLRLSLRRDGTVQGEPRVTFSNLSISGEARRALTQAALDAIRRCTPLDLAAGLGGAVAGRPIAIRFVFEGPRGQGV